MPYTRLTDKERDAVKREWHERVQRELGPQPTIRGAEGLVPNVALTRKRRDIHQRDTTSGLLQDQSTAFTVNVYTPDKTILPACTTSEYAPVIGRATGPMVSWVRIQTRSGCQDTAWLVTQRFDLVQRALSAGQIAHVTVVEHPGQQVLSRVDPVLENGADR